MIQAKENIEFKHMERMINVKYNRNKNPFMTW